MPDLAPLIGANNVTAARTVEISNYLFDINQRDIQTNAFTLQMKDLLGSANNKADQRYTTLTSINSKLQNLFNEVDQNTNVLLFRIDEKLGEIKANAEYLAFLESINTTASEMKLALDKGVGHLEEIETELGTRINPILLDSKNTLSLIAGDVDTLREHFNDYYNDWGEHANEVEMKLQYGNERLLFMQNQNSYSIIPTLQGIREAVENLQLGYNNQPVVDAQNDTTGAIEDVLYHLEDTQAYPGTPTKPSGSITPKAFQLTAPDLGLQGDSASPLIATVYVPKINGGVGNNGSLGGGSDRFDIDFGMSAPSYISNPAFAGMAGQLNQMRMILRGVFTGAFCMWLFILAWGKIN